MNDFRAPCQPLVPPDGVELHQLDMTATFGGGVMLGAAQHRLAEFGQWIPIDGNPNSSLSDLVCFNSTGPLRLGYGAWRDLLLGVQFRNGRGELISAGGRTVKNVAGYDLTKFMVGSAGIFGQIVAVTTRTYKMPEGALVARYSADVRILNRLIPTSLRPHWSMIAGGSLFCGYLGDRSTLDHYRLMLSASEPIELTERTVEDDQAERSRLWSACGDVTFRASVPPARISEFGEKLRDISWVADPAFGIVLGSEIADGQIRLIRDLASEIGGSVQFRHHGTNGQSLTLHPALDNSTSRAEQQIIERLKHAFDPDGKLNPLPR